MPPEQLLGDSVDARADIYTIGAVLYEMATDRRAFPEGLTSRLMDSILHQPPVSPRAINPRISTQLETIILKCLDKEADRRYQSATELLVDLRRPNPLPATRLLHPQSGAGLRMTYGAAGLLTLAVGLAAAMNVAVGVTVCSGHRDPQIQSLAVIPFDNLTGDANKTILPTA